MDKYVDCFSHNDKFYNQGAMMCRAQLFCNWKGKNLTRENLVCFIPINLFLPGPQNGTRHSMMREVF